MKMDLFYTYFQNLFFMRDWFEHSGIDKAKVKALFSSRHLKLCRDIVNGSKHLKIKEPCLDPAIATVREHESQFGANWFRADGTLQSDCKWLQDRHVRSRTELHE